MDSLNYHHLRYFWVVAREGGLMPAAKVLRLSHPTLSTQIQQLEEQLGEQLFSRSGRRLVLTEMGHLVLRYADDIFGLGRELVETVRGHATGRPARLRVGVVDAVPKLVVERLLQPALALPSPPRLSCFEDTLDKLLPELARHAIDLIISDAPVPSGASVRAYNHLLGDTPIGWFAAPSLARKLRRGFPRSLNGAPVLMPVETSPLRRALDHWLESEDLHPRVVAEFQDSALLKVFGARGMGVFPGALVVAREISHQFEAKLLGPAGQLRERFYAISAERRLKALGVLAITQAATHELFAAP